MTAINLATDIPSSINTLEKLSMWASLVLNNLYPEVTIIEAPGTSSIQASSAPFIANDGTNLYWINISRNTFRLNRNWQRGSQKIWTFTEDIGTIAIPAEFKS